MLEARSREREALKYPIIPKSRERIKMPEPGSRPFKYPIIPKGVAMEDVKGKMENGF